MADYVDFIRLDGEETTVVVAVIGGRSADCVYFGPSLDGNEDLASLHTTGLFGQHESQPDNPPVSGLLPERKNGYAGPVAIDLRESERRISTDFRPVRQHADGRCLRMTFEDSAEDLSVAIEWRIGAGDIICANTVLTNKGDKVIVIERLASLALPVPRRFDRIISYSGRWSGEMRETESPIDRQGIQRTSRRGKPGFDGGNWMLLCDGFAGPVIGIHLAWSGDHEVIAERDADGETMMTMGAALDGGEITLAPGETFKTPSAMVAQAPDRSALGQSWHRHLRQDLLPNRSEWSPRKVHLNSWEALGFDMDEAKLMALADSAADLGVERFVLDDGWFDGRRDDRTSLGDWTVSPDVLPNGLDPLITHIATLGMDFGLWIEPEMVNPDSELYRTHPDWCLHEPGRDRPTQRHQLVLDLTQREVSDYIFNRINALLSAHAIAYLKWDHNRDLFPAANAERPIGYAQTMAFYTLLDRLRVAHPSAEIESCSSGGGRIDFGVLSRCHRVWPSDNNDAIERLRINRAWAQFLPLEVMGSHVGPSPNPITGRKLDMGFRAKVSLFGHMGVETNPAAMNIAERDTLRAHIALYKHWRGILHGGKLFRIDHPDPGVSGLFAMDEWRGIALAAQTEFAAAYNVAPLRFAGLEPEAQYSVTLPEPWPSKASRYLTDAGGWRNGFILSGCALMERGIALPLTHPETAWLIAVERLPG